MERLGFEEALTLHETTSISRLLSWVGSQSASRVDVGDVSNWRGQNQQYHVMIYSGTS